MGSRRQRVREQVAERIGVTSLSEATVEQLEAVDLRTEAQEKMVFSVICSRGRDSIRQRIGRVPKAFNELKAFEPANDLERACIGRRLAFALPLPAFESTLQEVAECPFCGSSRLAGVGDYMRDTLSCHDCTSTWDKVTCDH